MRPLRLVRRIMTVATCFLILGALGQAKDSGPRAIGAGAHPISFTDASAWFANRADDNQKVLTLLVFFEGSAGWLDQQTNFNWDVNGSPAKIAMSVGKTEILVKYWSDTGEVEIQGTKYNVSNGNVFFVQGTDGAKPVVRALGVQDLSFSPDEIPPIALLRRNPAVWAALSGRPPGEHAKSHGTNASPEVVAWDTEGLRLLQTAKPESEKRACELFREAAEKGYAGSQYRLGYCYETGRGLVQNFSTANDWYEKAANQGYVDAQYKLGHSYRVGRGVAIDLATAIDWYKKAASNGDREAMHNVGWMYATGQGVKADPGQAYTWLLEAAKYGEISAQVEIARRLREGDGVAKDLTGSYSWLLVVQAQTKSIAPEGLASIKATMNLVASQLDKPALDKALEQAHELVAIIAMHEMEGFARA
jgi:TPR repeat protein